MTDGGGGKAVTRRGRTVSLCRRCGARISGGHHDCPALSAREETAPTESDSLPHDDERDDERAADRRDMSAYPTAFGKYELVSSVAAGGMAEVFLARLRSIRGFEKQLVIKKIQPGRTHDPDFVRMFLDEARLLATLDHPNIVQLYDVGEVDGEWFIAMEYLRGRNLVEIHRARANRGHRRLPLAETLSIVTAVCAGLHHAHDKRDAAGRPLGIVHRDVTPQNIVVTLDGGVKIVDFGIAKATSRKGRTAAGTIKGKAGYMSPEQCRGDRVDRRSDIFSLGVILYELTTGARAFRERSEFETLRRIIEGPVPSPAANASFYPLALDDIVVRCLQKDPADRFQTSRELHAALDDFARAHGLATGTLPLARYMECFFPEPAPRRNGSILAAADPLEVAGDALADPPTAARRRRTVRRGLVAGGAILAAAVGLLGWRAACGSSRTPASLTARR